MLSRNILLLLLVVFPKCSVGQLVECPLCPGGAAPNDPTARFTTPAGVTLTCENAFERGAVELTQSQCDDLQLTGVQVCSCANPLPPLTNCSLCENGMVLPQPLFEAPNLEACAAVEADAKRSPASLCSVYQRTYGVYCGCDNPTALNNTCNLCQAFPLPDPEIIIDINGTNISCGELEFDLNIRVEQSGLFSPACVDFIDSSLLASECCDLPPTAAPTSAAWGFVMSGSKRLIGLLSLLLMEVLLDML